MTSAASTAIRKRPSYNSTERSAADSREDIHALLARPDLDITNVEWVALGGRKSRLLLRIERRLYKIDIHAADTLKNPDKKFRRLHRGVLHLLKNAIAVAEEGLCNLGEILAAFLVTSDENVTVGEALLRLEAGSSRPVTLALASAETALVPVEMALPPAKTALPPAETALVPMPPTGVARTVKPLVLVRT